MSEEPGRFAAPQLSAYLREDPEGIYAKAQVEYSNGSGPVTGRTGRTIDEALAVIREAWVTSAPGRDAAVPGGNVQWGYRMRHVGGPHGKHARASEYVADDRADAEECVAHLLKTPENWEAEVLWRTAAVEPGPWQAVKAVPEPSWEQGEETPLQVVADLISLAGLSVPQEVIATWTDGEREQAASWAAAEHLSASDHPVARVPQPEFVRRAAEICASPALAQLAIEAWTRHREAIAVHDDPEKPWAGNVAAGKAQDAITGLLSLLGGGERLFTAEQMQASYDNGYVTARKHAATEEPL